MKPKSAKAKAFERWCKLQEYLSWEERSAWLKGWSAAMRSKPQKSK